MLQNVWFRRSKSIECFCISDDLNRHRFMKNHNPISNIDNDAHVILLQIRCLKWSISQTVFVPFRVLSEEVRLVDDIKYISTMNYLYIFTFVFLTFSHGCFSKVSNQWIHWFKVEWSRNIKQIENLVIQSSSFISA